MHTVFIHMANEEPFMAEIDDLPSPDDQVMICVNPRRRDGKDLQNILPEVQMIIVPWHRIHLVEVMPTGEEEEIVSPFAD